MSYKRIRLLRETPLFGGISEQALRVLLEKSVQREVPAGEVFFEEDDAASSMFVLEEGVVSVIKHWREAPVILHKLQSGDCFGEVALMDVMPRSATVRADSRCRAIELSNSALLALYQADLEQFTRIQMNLGREICRRLRYADARLFEVQRKS